MRFADMMLPSIISEVGKCLVYSEIVAHTFRCLRCHEENAFTIPDDITINKIENSELIPGHSWEFKRQGTMGKMVSCAACGSLSIRSQTLNEMYLKQETKKYLKSNLKLILHGY